MFGTQNPAYYKANAQQIIVIVISTENLSSGKIRKLESSLYLCPGDFDIPFFWFSSYLTNSVSHPQSLFFFFFDSSMLRTALTHDLYNLFLSYHLSTLTPFNLDHLCFSCFIYHLFELVSQIYITSPPYQYITFGYFVSNWLKNPEYMASGMV